MIIVQLKGGLGNQLFQYAAGLSLGKHHRVDVTVDVAELRQPDEAIGTFRAYELMHLIKPPAIASEEEIKNIKHKTISKRYLDKLFPSYKRTIYNEKQFCFDKNFFNSGNHIYLKGYRQSEKHFKPIEKAVQQDFQLQHELVADIKDFGKQLSSINSVSIHVRRGDYANTAVTEYHGSLDKDYYQRAIDKISSVVPDPTFFVFSDDINWVKNNVTFEKSVAFISGSISTTHYEDFYLMSCCRHNIIANSSFSWWAAWLNLNPNKAIIAPKKWFNNPKLNSDDLIPGNWMKL
jgi:hypothetical protein